MPNSSGSQGTYSSQFRTAGEALALAVLYFVAAKLGLMLASVQANATPVWAPTGIALAACLIFGYRVWPGLLLGAFFANVTTSGTIATSIGIAIGNTLEGVVGAYLVNQFANGRRAFERAPDIFKFVGLAAVVATAVSATIGVTTLSLAGFSSWHSYSVVWGTWWLGDLGGAIIVAPLIIIWVNQPRLRLKQRQVLEFILLLICLLLVSQVVFGSGPAAIASFYPLKFLTIPLLIWAAFRFSQREAAVALVVVTAVAIWNTVHGAGSLPTPVLNQALVLVQVFMAVMAVMTMSLAAVVAERRSNEAYFRALIDHSFDVVLVIDQDATITYASPSSQWVGGYDPEEVIGMNGFTFIHPDDVARAKATLAKAARIPNGIESQQFRVRRKDGRWIWIEAVLTNLLNHPAVHGLVLNYRDITQVKVSQRESEIYTQELAEEKAKDEALLESLGEGIIATDETGKIILVNEAFEKLLGLTAKQVVGRRTAEVIRIEDEHGHSLAEEARALHLAFSKGTTVKLVHYLVRSDGTKFPAAVVATPVVLQGRVVGAIETLDDITQDVAIDKAKTEFVSLASHQLRTPLTAIKWYTGALLNQSKPRLQPKMRQSLETIHSSNERMINLVNSLLNVSRIELGTLMVTPKPVNVTELAQAIIGELKAELKLKKLKFTSTYEEVPLIKTDPDLAQVILQNVLENAIRYTPPGGTIQFEVRRGQRGSTVAGKQLAQDSVVFVVRDSGVGIPRAQQPQVFTKLFRTDSAVRMVPDGTGLGLYIVKSTLAYLGGQVWFESKEKHGSTFYLSLPLSGVAPRPGNRHLT